MKKLKTKKVKPLPKVIGADDLDKFDVDIHAFLDDRNYIGAFEAKEKLKFLGAASSIFTNEAFAKVVNELMNIQACHSILQAPTSQLIMFDRSGINILKLLKEEFKRLDGLYRDLVKKEETYDENEVI